MSYVTTFSSNFFEDSFPSPSAKQIELLLATVLTLSKRGIYFHRSLVVLRDLRAEPRSPSVARLWAFLRCSVCSKTEAEGRNVQKHVRFKILITFYLAIVLVYQTFNLVL